jgi:uncharacterized protein (DUF2062 family)
MAAALSQHAQIAVRQATTTTSTPNLQGLQVISVGALVGAIVGGVLVIILIGLIAWLIIARRRRSKTRAAGLKQAA